MDAAGAARDRSAAAPESTPAALRSRGRVTLYASSPCSSTNDTQPRLREGRGGPQCQGEPMVTQSRNEYVPQRVSPPGATLADLLAEWALSKRELAKRMGRATKSITELIDGATAITQDVALALELAVGVPASFWIARERRYRACLASRR